MEYPKINSLYKRRLDGDRSLILGQYSCPEFEAIDSWTITEKVDGTNIRIIYDVDEKGPKLTFGGRTKDAAIPCHLLSMLMDKFTVESMQKQFPTARKVILFGEGYGPKIQSGGYYRKDPGFALFDVWVGGWWLEPDAVHRIGESMGLDLAKPLSWFKARFQTPPSDSFVWKTDDIVEYVRNKHKSSMAAVEDHTMEGIIARSSPLMLFRDGKPIMFKLKCCDF